MCVRLVAKKGALPTPQTHSHTRCLPVHVRSKWRTFLSNFKRGKKERKSRALFNCDEKKVKKKVSPSTSIDLTHHHNPRLLLYSYYSTFNLPFSLKRKIENHLSKCKFLLFSTYLPYVCTFFLPDSLLWKVEMFYQLPSFPPFLLTARSPPP